MKRFCTFAVAAILFASGCSSDDTNYTKEDVVNAHNAAISVCDDLSDCGDNFFGITPDGCKSEVKDWSVQDDSCADLGVKYYNCLKDKHCSGTKVAGCLDIEDEVQKCLNAGSNNGGDNQNTTNIKKIDIQCTVNAAFKDVCEYKCAGTWEECIEHSGMQSHALMLKCENDVVVSKSNCHDGCDGKEKCK